MDTQDINSLSPNRSNPRRISEHDFISLKNSLKAFGDLSGIVFNRQTQQLVGGHQRVQAFKQLPGDKPIIIMEQYDQPTAVGTVAIGYVIMEGEKYTYRVVDWEPDRELAANIAANRIQGEWDLELLAEADAQLYENDQSLLILTGQTDDEVSKLLGDAGVVDQGEPEPYIAPRSQPGVTYRLGAHTITVGSMVELGNVPDSIGGVGFVDDMRRSYAKLMGREDEWESLTPAIQNAMSATQSPPEPSGQS